MSAWRVLDLLDFEGVVSSSPGRLVMTYPESDSRGERTTALVDVHTALIGENTTLTAGAVRAAGEYGVSLLFCDWRGVPLSTAAGFSRHTLSGERQRGQLQQTIAQRRRAWRSLVVSKVRGQARVLQLVGDSEGGDLLSRLAGEVRSGDAGNVEAQAARIYWSRLGPLAGDPGFRRIPGGRTSGLNSFLNYGYTVVRGAVLGAVLAAGLWPAVGVHHDNVRNAWCLVDDLIEPLRPAVDIVAGQLSVSDADIEHPEVRRALVAVLHDPFDGSGSSVQTVARRIATEYSLHVAEEAAFDPPVWDGRERREGA